MINFSMPWLWPSARRSLKKKNNLSWYKALKLFLFPLIYNLYITNLVH